MKAEQDRCTLSPLLQFSAAPSGKFRTDFFFSFRESQNEEAKSSQSGASDASPKTNRRGKKRHNDGSTKQEQDFDEQQIAVSHIKIQVVRSTLTRNRSDSGLTRALHGFAAFLHRDVALVQQDHG